MSKKQKYLIIHCTATPEGREVTSDEIRDWHLNGRGWSRLGYSDMVHLDGSVENLTEYNHDRFIDNDEMTWGVAGINSISRHIAYVGGVNANDVKKAEDTRTAGQKYALEILVKEALLRNSDLLIAGHNQFANKACPSFDILEWSREIGISEENIYKK